ncbi:hypothetical protein EJD97_016250 [Solanum chilense]|uniref:Uncharacterized protein n=1 Tax=Solanum chilense TaxID=4083 RepID=A0A6N2ALA6_SOLCI|nr:hypothetical protein EJD97_016250 [Solanum chilense]
MMVCHDRRRLTICADQGPYRNAFPDVIRSCVLSKGDNNMPRLTSCDCGCYPRETMACDARRRSTVCAAQVLCGHATPDNILPAMTGYHAHKSSDRVCYPKAIMECRPTSSNGVCFPRVMMACYDRRRPIMCCPSTMWACHARRHQTVCGVQG